MLTNFDIEIEKWVKQWTPFIQKFAKNLGLIHTDIDDWLQTARTVYWEVRDKFEEDGGKSLNSFILDMLKLRLIDLKRAEGNQNRFWLRESLSLSVDDTFCACPEGRALELNVSDDSKTILKLLYSGYSVTELRRNLGIPSRSINKAKDELMVQFAKEDRMKLRVFLEERARELGISIEEDEKDYEVANRILSHGHSVKRRFRIVPAVNGTGDKKEKNCGYCEDNTAVDGSKFCSLMCAEKAFKDLKKEKVRKKAFVKTAVDHKKEFEGDICEESIRGLVNPFPPNTGANEVFELFRVGGTKKILAENLDKVLLDKNIKCISPDERIRRVITDTRARGFELAKSKGGFFKLTGRRK